ncbi:DUF3833 domain-containing protein [Pelomonas sp. Root1444]|uniref:DUF3833 domain-containing protein n=1 Tax=Pelomonas sp. Root1444 TaxID=1736464 RepID=UPI0007038E37|nr:DUF3833 domain-containing protein [Pelomonas sp. Root1444]KQY90465.1 hypothetical protein ASD35_01220 [Pelomonas sp. Root1444]
MNRRLLLTTLVLSGCASAPVPEDYAAEKPVLSLETYFNGPLTAHGLFTDRAGKVKRRFIVKLEGRWQGGVGTLEEDFSYSDGKTERRVWTITALGDGRYRGTAADVVGEAVGEARGNALRWSYTLRLPVDGTTYDVQLDDWMYLMDDKVMLNKARMSKFGFHLGDVTLSFHKP